MNPLAKRRAGLTALPTRPPRPTATLVGMVPRYPSWSSSRIVPLSPTMLLAPQPLVLTDAVWEEIRRTVGVQPAEHGGPLGGARGSGVVERFQHDTTSARTRGTYYPDVAEMNRLLREEWNPEGTNLLGFVHSHPAGALRPSRNDLDYAGRILAGIPELERFLLPIAQTTPDTGSFTLRGYAAVRSRETLRLEDVDVLVVPASAHSEAVPAEFARVTDAYDMQVMERARLVTVGCGGSAAFLEDMARAGVAEIVLIDPDVVEAPNIGTQQSYRSAIGMAKVDALALRLVDISPTLRVWTLRTKLEELDDDAVRRLAVGWLPGALHPAPTATVLCAFTDTFEVQARVHRLGLHLGVPVVGGTVYKEGRGIELTFAAQGVTSACIRCAQSSRYAAYLDHGYQNEVGSVGAPIMATARLNAMKIPIVLGLLHTVSRSARPEHGATRRFCRLIERVANRNLVVASLDPDIYETLGLPMFAPSTAASASGADSDEPFDVVKWRHPTPDDGDHGAPICPDCGGTGDLSTSMGRFMSTGPMPRVFGEHRFDGKH